MIPWQTRVFEIVSISPQNYHHCLMRRRKITDKASPDISKRKMLVVILQTLADMRYELKKDIANLDRKLSSSLDGVASTLCARIEALASDLHSFRIEMHQNQLMFMNVHDQLERRVTVLETRVG